MIIKSLLMVSGAGTEVWIPTNPTNIQENKWIMGKKCAGPAHLGKMTSKTPQTYTFLKL